MRMTNLQSVHAGQSKLFVLLLRRGVPVLPVSPGSAISNCRPRSRRVGTLVPRAKVDPVHPESAIINCITRPLVKAMLMSKCYEMGPT